MTIDLTNDQADRPTVWEVNPDHPDGYARPMTDDEYAQWQADQAAAAAVAKTPAPLSVQERVAGALESIPDGPITKDQISGVIAALLDK